MPSAAAPTASAAERAVAHLKEISPELRGCAILTGTGEVLAATGDPASWGEAGRDLIAAANAAAPEPAAYAHVATGDGEVFLVRDADFSAVAVTERFVLASLMVFDLRAALRDLAG